MEYTLAVISFDPVTSCVSFLQTNEIKLFFTANNPYGNM